MTRDETTLIKGLAILMMLIHHLWGFPLRVPDLDLYQWQIQIGEAGKICVIIFLFLSGYGLTRSSKLHRTTYYDTWHKIKKTYLLSWKVFFLFIPLGIAMGGVTYINIWNLIQNIFFFKFNSCNSEWWYIRLYILLLLLFPLINRIGNKYFFLFAILSSATTRYLSTFCHDLPIIFEITYYYAGFAIGMLFARYSIYENDYRLKSKTNRLCLYCSLILFIILCTIIRKKADMTFMTILIVPALIYLILRMNINLWLKDLLSLLGKHSMYMWLIHPFFCYYFLREYFYGISMGNPYIAYFELVVISFSCSELLKIFWNRVGLVYSKLRNISNL